MPNKSARDHLALDRLRELLPPGATVYMILKHTSKSGMVRDIQPVAIVDGAPLDLTYLVSQVGFKRGPNPGIRVSGVGMDMGFYLVYSLSRALYPEGFACTGHRYDGVGPRCLSNDHSNDREINYDPARIHSDGGYALKQSWL